jgi:protein-disulfide isomerase
MIARLLSVALLASMLMAAPARAQEEQPLNSKQSEAVKKLIRDYLMDNPQVIAEALEALREKERLVAEQDAQRALKDLKEEIQNDPEAPVAGNPKGDVVLVEFFDYRCTYCKSVSDTIFETVAKDGKIKLVLKEFPILGPESVLASRAALASRAQKKYIEFHRALMKVRGPLNEQTIMKTASDVGLNVDQLRKDMQSTDVENALRKNLTLARALNLAGTPTFIIGDRIIPTAVDQATLKQLVDQARKPKT